MSASNADNTQISVFVHGAFGRVGKITLDMAMRTPGFRAVGGADVKAGDGGENSDLPIHKGMPGGLPRETVIIDFSLSGAVAPLVESLRSRGNPLVSGTTGLDPAERDALRAYSEVAPVLYDENMSYGISAMKKILETASPLMRDIADVEIVEFHHSGKRDFPSGTAYALARVIDPDASVVTGRQTGQGAGSREIPIHSGRVGGLPGEHRVVFATDEEMITIEHRAITRDVFARGALRAARFVAGKRNGLFCMKDLLEAKNE
jgi:4-hydroxy-tetrahydrodipicolinate reductase